MAPPSLRNALVVLGRNNTKSFCLPSCTLACLLNSLFIKPGVGPWGLEYKVHYSIHLQEVLKTFWEKSFVNSPTILPANAYPVFVSQILSSSLDISFQVLVSAPQTLAFIIPVL